MTGRVSATLANTADGVTPTGPASSSHRSAHSAPGCVSPVFVDPHL